MKNKKKLCIAGGVLLVLGIMVLMAQGSINLNSSRSNIYRVAPVPNFVYSAKFVCGATNISGGPVLKGNYATAINVHNPQNIVVNFTKKAVIALREESRGNKSNKINFALDPDAAFEIDCTDIDQILNISQIPMPSFAKGFVVIESPDELDVVGVYTAGGANVESIDVETTNPKTIIPCGKTNLTLNTGQDKHTDPYWAVTDPPYAATPDAFVVTNPNIQWASPLPGSQWISWQASAASGPYPLNYTNYTYDLNFTLPPCFSNPILNLSGRADNEGWVFLNGKFIGTLSTFNVVNPPPIIWSNDFVSGTNELTVIVRDDPPGVVTGLDLAGTVTAT